MRNSKTNGFTLIELLIVIAIIGILAAVLIPNLLNARSRAFDTAAQTCLKEISTHEEVLASVDPWEYTSTGFTKASGAGVTLSYTHDGASGSEDIQSCEGIIVTPTTHTDSTVAGGAATSNFAYLASHTSGANTFRIDSGRGVVHHADGVQAEPSGG